MTLLSGHELATALVTVAALLAVLTGGQLHPLAWATLLAVPVGWVMRLRHVSLPTGTGGALALAAVLYGAAFTWAEGLPSILQGAGYSLCMLVAVRLLNRETPAHDLQLYALSLLLLLDAAALNVNWIYAPCFLTYTIAIVWALTTRELKRAAQADHEARHGKGEAPLWRERGVLKGRFFVATAVMAVVVLFGTLSLFIVFPRVGLGILRLGSLGRTSGFASSITLGTGGLISPDNTVVMRVRPRSGEDLPLTLYFRGSAFDRYDGTTWSRSSQTEQLRFDAASRMPAPRGARTRYRVSLEPLGVPYVFAAGAVARVQVEPGPRILVAPPVVTRDGLGDMVLPSPPDEMLNYEVEADLRGVEPSTLAGSGVDYPAMVADLYLTTTGVSDAVKQLGKEWAAGAVDPVDKVEAIARHLRGFAYTLEDEVPPAGINALDHFLFTRKAGHCEYFASALAVLARVNGVPARVVGGYQGGALHRRGYLVLRQSDAHAWTEIYIPGHGWTGTDITPASVLARPGLSAMASLTETLQQVWEDYVVDFDLALQVQAARSVSEALSSLRALDLSVLRRPVAGAGGGWLWATGAVLVVLAWFTWRRPRRKRVHAHRLFVALEAAVARVSGSPRRTETVREWVEAVRPYVDTVDAATLDGARDAYERCRFGGHTLSPAEEAHWVERLQTVRTSTERKAA